MGNQGQDGKYRIGPRILNPCQDANEVFTIFAPDFLGVQELIELYAMHDLEKLHAKLLRMFYHVFFLLANTRRDQFRFPGNCPPTPPISQQKHLLLTWCKMLAKGGSRWAVSQKPKLIQKKFLTHHLLSVFRQLVAVQSPLLPPEQLHLYNCDVVTI